MSGRVWSNCLILLVLLYPRNPHHTPVLSVCGMVHREWVMSPLQNTVEDSPAADEPHPQSLHLSIYLILHLLVLSPVLFGAEGSNYRMRWKTTTWLAVHWVCIYAYWLVPVLQANNFRTCSGFLAGSVSQSRRNTMCTFCRAPSVIQLWCSPTSATNHHLSGKQWIHLAFLFTAIRLHNLELLSDCKNLTFSDLSIMTEKLCRDSPVSAEIPVILDESARHSLHVVQMFIHLRVILPYSLY